MFSADFVYVAMRYSTCYEMLVTTSLKIGRRLGPTCSWEWFPIKKKGEQQSLSMWFFKVLEISISKFLTLSYHFCLSPPEVVKTSGREISEDLQGFLGRRGSILRLARMRYG